MPVSISNLATTWTNSGTTYTGIKLNVTDTASAAASLLMDLQVGGSSQFKVSKSGQITASGTSIFNEPSVLVTPSNNGSGIFAAATNAMFGFYDSISKTNVFGVGYTSARLSSAASMSWCDGTNVVSAQPDLALFRDAANILAQRNDTNAQTFRLYRSYTDASNYSRLSLTWSSSTAVISANGAGTGTNGNVAFGTAALATNATVGHLMIPSCAGTATGVPADIPTGQAALVYDSTNKKLGIYDGGWIWTAALS